MTTKIKVARLENMRNQIPGKDNKPEERKRTKERKNKKRNKKCFTFHFSQ